MKQRTNERTNEISTVRRGHRSSVFYVPRQKIRLDVALYFSLFSLSLSFSLFWIVVIGEKSSRVIIVRTVIYI